MTIKDSLLAIVNYPVPAPAIENIVGARELVLEDEATQEVRLSDSYRLAKADLLKWTSFAPNVSQGGVSIDISVTDRKEFRERANLIYKELNDPEYKPTIRQVFTFEGEDV